MPVVFALAFLLAAGWSTLAVAHVKWFAPFSIEAPPHNIADAFADPWFWVAAILVLMFFTGTQAVEQSSLGRQLLASMDRLTAPVWSSGDMFIRTIIGMFFVAIFAVGGVYLTPELAAPAPWVSWFQLLVAVGLFWRWSMPLSALGIVLLWAAALGDFPLFHLLDYLALVV